MSVVEIHFREPAKWSDDPPSIRNQLDKAMLGVGSDCQMVTVFFPRRLFNAGHYCVDVKVICGKLIDLQHRMMFDNAKPQSDDLLERVRATYGCPLVVLVTDSDEVEACWQEMPELFRMGRHFYPVRVREIT